MTRCETIRSTRLIEQLHDGFLDAEAGRRLGEHIASCVDCALVAEAVKEETDALRVAASYCLDTAVLRRRPRLLVSVSIFALLLIGVGLLAVRPWHAAPDPSEEGVLTVDVAGGWGAARAAPGYYSPPCFGQMLLFADWVVLANVERVEQSTGDGLKSADIWVLVGRHLFGRTGIVPARVCLHVSPGVSELGPREAAPAVGEQLLLLLSKDKKGIRLTTGDAHSVIRKANHVFTESALVRFRTLNEFVGLLKRTLDLRERLESLPWEQQETVLIRALQGGENLAREFALDWYSYHRIGSASDHLALRPENRNRKPRLDKVEKALAILLMDRSGRVRTAPRKAFQTLARSGQSDYTRWVKALTSPELGEPAYALLRGIARGYDSAKKEALRAALVQQRAPEAPLSRYLAAGILYELGDVAPLTVILEVKLKRDIAHRLASWTALRPGRAWPPLAYVKSLTGRDFETTDEARAWIAAEVRK